jgi:ABC-2 type transport system ATP-binding protein
VTIFLTTHNLAEAEKLCQQVGVIRQGKLLAVGPLGKLQEQAGGLRVEILGKGFTPELLEQMRGRPEVRSLRSQNGNLSIELSGDVEVAPLVRLLVTAGADVEEVRKDRANLEEMFLALVGEDENGARGGK